MKLGVAVAFVLLFFLARDSWIVRWTTYAFVWWVMFALIEAGQAITPDYSWLAAVGGIISEAIYFPLSASVVARLLAPPGQGGASL
jgi:membrane associated rhomboid family serine protease